MKINYTIDANRKKIHFMGIGGSGMSGVALMASQMGYQVSGCDLESSTAYSKELSNAVSNIYHGHNTSHLAGVSILVVTPAVYFQSKKNPELVLAEKTIEVMTWQEFLGKYLQIDKKVICVAGTHGKSTTTALLALIFAHAGLDPSVVLGAEVSEWKSNSKLGIGDFFITEADEFYDNFLNYSPFAIILNNIEFDHPDYFSNPKAMMTSFRKFVSRLVGRRLLVVNMDSPGIIKLLKSLDKKFLNNITLVGYGLQSTHPDLDLEAYFYTTNVDSEKEFTRFKIMQEGQEKSVNFQLALPGVHNVANALGVTASELLK